MLAGTKELIPTIAGELFIENCQYFVKSALPAIPLTELMKADYPIPSPSKS